MSFGKVSLARGLQRQANRREVVWVHVGPQRSDVVAHCHRGRAPLTDRGRQRHDALDTTHNASSGVGAPAEPIIELVTASRTSRLRWMVRQLDDELEVCRVADRQR